MSRVIDNISWLSVEKIIRALIGAILTIYLSNQLGRLNFGIYSLLLSTFAIAAFISSMGIKSVFIKYLVTDEIQNSQLVSSAIALLFLGSTITSIIVIVIAIATDYLNGYELLLFTYIFAIYVNIASIANFWFESQKMQKYNVFAGLISFLFFAIFKVLCIYFNLDLKFLLASICLEFILQGILICLILYKKGYKKIFFSFNSKTTVYLIKESFPYWITGGIVMLNIRMDQYILAYMLDVESVAIYAVAARFAEFLWFIPLVLCSSFFPILINIYEKSSKDEFYEYLKNLMCFLYIVSLMLSIMLFGFSDLIISIFFNSEYTESSIIMSILAFSIIPLSFGTIGSQYTVLKKYGAHSIYRVLVALIFNLILNLILIPIYGTAGAAIALIISQFCSSLFIDIFFARTKKLFFIKVNALNPIYSARRFYNFIIINKELLKS